MPNSPLKTHERKPNSYCTYQLPRPPVPWIIWCSYHSPMILLIIILCKSVAGCRCIYTKRQSQRVTRYSYVCPPPKKTPPLPAINKRDRLLAPLRVKAQVLYQAHVRILRARVATAGS